MRSITSWQRLEPKTRNDALTDALEAPVADPLWLLGRQWQVGEFEGIDGGSPVAVDVELTNRPVSAYRLGGPDDPDGGVGSYGPDGPPLESVIEREQVRPEPDEDLSGPRNCRDAAQAGAHFLRMLAARGIDEAEPSDFADSDVLDSYPDVDGLLLSVPEEGLDAEGKRYALAVSGRALDGDALYRVFEAADGGSSGPMPVPDPSLRTGEGSNLEHDEEYVDAVGAYMEWYEELYDEPEAAGEAWDEQRMEYRFAVGVGDGDERAGLVADGYKGGRLDWHHFSGPEEPIQEPVDGWGTETKRITRTALPTPIRVPGMPARRWWELEDSTVNVSRIEAAAEDLSRLLLVEYSLVAGNDWFRVPLELDVGSFARVDRLAVTDSFGHETVIEHTGLTDSGSEAPEDPWNMYGFLDQLENEADEVSMFLPPTFVETIETDAIESVDFVRDEAVNVAWAVEEAVEGPTGDRVDRHEQSQQAAAGSEDTPVQPVTNADGIYDLTTGVPAHWLPLVPELRDVGAVDLRLGEMLATDEDAETDPLGDVLDEPNLVIPEEEVPRAGKRVTRQYQLARWTDGSTHLWSGREVGRGRGSAASGLRFDTVEYQTPSPSAEQSPIGVAVVSPTSSGGAFENLHEEYIILRNETDDHLALEGWTVADGANHEYVFGDIRLDPGGVVHLHTGEQLADGDDEGTHVYWGSGAAVWNDMTDAIYVYDDDGDLRAVQTYPDLSPTVDSPLEVSALVDPPGDDRNSLNDEYVTIENTGEQAVTLTGWTVRDITGHEFAFPEGFTLTPNGEVTIHTGKGPNTDTDLYWRSTSPIWNNAGDAVLVYDERDALVAGALVRGEDRRHLPTFPLPRNIFENLPRDILLELPLGALSLADLDALQEIDFGGSEDGENGSESTDDEDGGDPED